MQTASQANTATSDTQTNLTYVDILVSGATTQGLSFIMVEKKYITTAMITALKGLGYTISVRTTDNPDFSPYTITW